MKMYRIGSQFDRWMEQRISKITVNNKQQKIEIMGEIGAEKLKLNVGNGGVGTNS